MLNEIKESFINETKEKSKVGYKRKIDVFFEFLQNECYVNDKNFKETLRGIGIDKILMSIDYYVHMYGIQYKVTIDNYFTVIKSFFVFISKKYNINNILFDSNAELENLNNNVNIKCKELKLKKTKLKDIISDSEFNVLLNSCNSIIRDYNVNNYKNEGVCQTDTSLFLSAIMMKVVMYTGIKNTVIPTIRIRDYDESLNKIIINGVKLDLPDDLAMDLRKYYKVRNNILRVSKGVEDIEKEDIFFITKYGDYIEIPESSVIYKVMKNILKTNEGESLAKYVVMKQLEAGADILQIIELTRLGFDACMHCREELTLSLDNKKTKEIALRLRASELFDIL